MNAPLFRIGTGYDIHPLKPGRRCVLGGVEIPSEVGPDGHSDADVLSHAIADAILGAAGLPDIGHFFPNTDSQFKDLDSQEILRRAVLEIKKLGYEIQNIDTAVIAEKPKLSPFISRMKMTLAVTLGIAENCIGIKATTNEKLDDLGAGKGIAVHAVCLLAREKN